MRFKYTNIGAKTYKTLSIILALTILMSGLGVWYAFVDTSNTADALTAQEQEIANKRIDALEKTIGTAATFYDYYYDNQVNGTDNATTYTQGDVGGAAQKGSPYTAWNQSISSMNSTYPLYLGGFWIDDNSSSYTESYISSNLSDYTNFFWMPNISQRGSNASMAVQGLVSSTLSNGSLMNYDGQAMPYFDSSFLSGTEVVQLSAVSYTGFSAPTGNGTWSSGNYTITEGYTTNIYIYGSSGTNYVDVNSSQSSDGSTKIKVYFNNWGGYDSCPSDITLSFGTASRTASKQSSDDGNNQAMYVLDITNDYGNLKTSANSLGDVTDIDNFPFYLQTEKDGSGNYTSYSYVFDSTNSDHVVYVDKNTSTLIDKMNDGGIYSIKNGYPNSSTTGFYPFNKNTSDNTSAISQANLNYGFGVTFSIEFELSTDGKDYLGNDMIFKFQGDDDVWVFIDDQLVLDIGGDHGIASGEINFANGTYLVNSAGTYQTVTIDSSNKNSTDGANGGNTNAAFSLSSILGSDYLGKSHKLTMFYMERGMLESNLFVSMNMIVIPNENTLTIKNAVNADNVNAGLKAQTLAVADNDVFEYVLSNKGTAQSDVESTGVLYPTYDYVRRYNTAATGNPNVLLSGKTASTTTETVVDSDYIYLSTAFSSGSWTDANAVLGAWIWKDGGESGHFQYMSLDSSSGYYKTAFDTSQYDRIMFLRLSPDNTLPTEGQTTWPSNAGSTIWNQIETVEVSSLSTQNLYSLTNWGTGEWSTTAVTKTVTTTSEVTEDKWYTPGTDTSVFYAVAQTNYELTDPFAQIKGSDNSWSAYTGTADTTAGQTSSTGSLNLMYGEAAKFTGQFVKGSTMQVVQSTNLNKPTVRSSDSTVTGFESSGRSVITYYTTTVTLSESSVDYANKSLSDYNTESNQFSYSNNSSEKVQITQTFTNTIKTGALQIVKNVVKGDTSTAGTFTFKVTLSSLFGDEDTDVSDYSGITYTLDGVSKTLSADGTFTMGPNQTAIIAGIPYGTKYTVTETTDGNYNKISGEVTTGTEMTSDSVTVTVTNERLTGALVLAKDVKNYDGSECTDSADTSQTFTMTVTLTAPTGVDLSKYISGYSSYDNGVMTITKSVSEDSSATITGIPYGTGYTVSESTAQGWTAVTQTVSGTISAASTTATLVNKKDVELTTNAYLTITKYIDSLYYDSDDNAHGFGENYSIIGGNDTNYDEHGYLEYTDAEQDFTFEVKEYDGTALVGTYQVLLKFAADTARLATAITENGIAYCYVQSKSFAVNAGHTYEITEKGTGTGISWRYTFQSAKGEANSPTNASTSGQTVTVEYAASATSAQTATAIFYNARTQASQSIESDMSSVTNTIVTINPA